MRHTAQANKILTDLQSGQTITPLDALRRYKCFRLSGRIFDLRKMGYPIETRIIETKEGSRVAEYSLKTKGK